MDTPIQAPGRAGQDMTPAMALALIASFGSVEGWREDFVAMGKASGDGSGRLLLSLHPREGRLLNQWVANPEEALAGGTPILAMDVRELAKPLDHGAQAGADVDDFMATIAWDEVYQRYQQAVQAASEELAADPDTVDPRRVSLLDVRREAIYEQAATMLPGACWRNPARVAEWAATLATGSEVLVYCVYGHEVGRATALRLRAQGIRARFLVGGIDRWSREGRELQPSGTAG